MTDILVSKGLHRTVIIPKTNKGLKWLEGNINNERAEPALSINSEFTDDFIKDLEKAGLEVEVK